jgi:hypothetical protein
LWDNLSINNDLIFNPFGQVTSTIVGKFILMNDDGDGVFEPLNDEYWVMCIDYVFPYFDPNLGRIVLMEDYLCFYAIDVDNDGIFNWHPWLGFPEDEYWFESETWMTEQWHTLPDLYTDISIDQGTDETKHQLYMLTSTWYSDQSQLRIPYYEDGALRNNQSDWYEFYVPDFLFNSPFPVTIEIFLYWIHDIQDIELELYAGDRTTLLAGSYYAATSQEVISFEVNSSGKYWVRVWGVTLVEDLAPEPYDLYIEVRGQGARVKFWYDPENCDDIYVSTTDMICGESTVCRYGDIDGDGYIGPIDLTSLADAWGKSEGDQGYSDCFDFDGDNYIGPVDLSEFASHWGDTYTAPGGPCSNWGPWP